MVLLGLVVLVTSFLSGIFGMAGGMLLMGYLLIVLPLQSAMVLHGLTQMTSNGWRAILWREHILWPVVGRFTAGALVSVGLFWLIRFVPDKALTLIAIGLTPIIALAVPQRLAPNVLVPVQAFVAGLLCTAVQMVAGVTGPLLDLFFVRSGLTRQSNVATKAVLQVIGHALKVVYFGSLIVWTDEHGLAPEQIGLAVVAAMAGTTLSRRILDAMSDRQFYTWSQRIIFAISTVYVWRGAFLLWPK